MRVKATASGGRCDYKGKGKALMAETIGESNFICNNRRAPVSHVKGNSTSTKLKHKVSTSESENNKRSQYCVENSQLPLLHQYTAGNRRCLQLGKPDRFLPLAEIPEIANTSSGCQIHARALAPVSSSMVKNSVLESMRSQIDSKSKPLLVSVFGGYWLVVIAFSETEELAATHHWTGFSSGRILVGAYAPSLSSHATTHLTICPWSPSRPFPFPLALRVDWIHNWSEGVFRKECSNAARAVFCLFFPFCTSAGAGFYWIFYVLRGRPGRTKIRRSRIVGRQPGTAGRAMERLESRHLE
nr:hypothetical protein Iba_chr14bCG11550 [Ipomoea batatas]